METINEEIKNDVINYIENNLKIRIKNRSEGVFNPIKIFTVQLYLKCGENTPEKIISESSVELNTLF